MTKTVNELWGHHKVKTFTPKLAPVDCSAPKQVIGMELETENVGRVGGSQLDAIASLGIRVTADNSLRGSAAEYITSPMAMSQMIPTLEKFYGTMNFSAKNYSERCSIHVHADVGDFNFKQLSTLCLAYTTVESILFNFIERNLPEGIPSREQNIFCVPWSQCRLNYQLVNNLWNNPAGSLRNWQKYTALNLVPVQTQGSVEFRHMFGTADMKIISQWLNLIGCLMNVATTTPYEELEQRIKILNDVSNYQHYFNSIFGKYLNYDDNYQHMLYDGVLGAKLSLSGLVKESSKVPLSKFTYLPDPFDPPPAPEIAAERPNADPALQRRIAAEQERLERFNDRVRLDIEMRMRGVGEVAAPVQEIIPPRPERIEDILNAQRQAINWPPLDAAEFRRQNPPPRPGAVRGRGDVQGQQIARAAFHDEVFNFGEDE